MAEVRAFYGRVKFLQPVITVWATTAGRARAEILRQAREAGYRVRLPDVQVRVGQAPMPDDYWPEYERRRRAQPRRGEHEG